MVTAMDSKQIISDLNDMIKLDFDAIAAYEAAIERLDSSEYKAQLTEFMGDHKRHVEELSQQVLREGGSPPDEGGALKIMTKGKVVIAALVGDEAILKAMSANETVTNEKYEEAVKTGYAQPVQDLLTQGLADERRHKAWLEMIIEKL